MRAPSANLPVRRRGGLHIITRTATCRCSQLKATCRGEPVRVSVCHCPDCQKRSGSAFAAQARWANADVEVAGEAAVRVRIADSDHRVTHRFFPLCGSTLACAIEGWPGLDLLSSPKSPPDPET